MQKYADVGKEGNKPYDTREKQIEELVADSMFDVFTNKKAVDKLASQNRTLAEKLRDQIRSIAGHIKAAIRYLGKSGKKPEIEALMDKADVLDEIAERFHTALEKAGQSFAENKTPTSEPDVRYSVKDNKKITARMTDSERTEILRNKVIVAPVYKGQADDAVSREKGKLDSKKRSLVESALLRIADEFGVYTDNKEKYKNADLQLSVSFSKGSVRESAHKEVTDATQLAKLMPILKEAVKTAIGIESHDNRYYYDNMTTCYHELLGGYIDKNSFIPIRFGLKELNDGSITLHVVVSQEKTKTEVMGTEHMENSSGDPAPHPVTFSIPRVASFVNTPDLLRYLPDGLLNKSQKEIKYKALTETMRYTNQKNDKAYEEALTKGDKATAQRMVDAAARTAGYTIKAYHGTPNGTFNIFKDWQYFTESKWYADVYQNQGASSNGYKTTANNPRTYEVYISPDNVFDTRKAEHRKIFMDEFYQKWGNGAPLSEKGLPDWTDGEDLIEFFEEKGYNFDAFYIDEGATGGYGDEVIDRGASLVVHKSNQIKSADPITYDENGNVIPISERFKENNNDIRYSHKDDESYSDKYSYNSLVSKPDMQLTLVDSTNVPDNRADIINEAKRNASKIGTKSSENSNIEVLVNDIGRNVTLTKHGLVHGLSRGKNLSKRPISFITVQIGEILKNSIRINELTPSKQDVSESYILIGAAYENNNLYIVRSIINNYTNDLMHIDVLYAVNTKEETAVLNAPAVTNKSLRNTVSTISISDLLGYVNKYFPDVLPEDVLKHYGHTERPEGEIGKSALYSHKDDAEPIKAYFGELAKENKSMRNIMGLLHGFQPSGKNFILKNKSVKKAARTLFENQGIKNQSLDEFSDKLMGKGIKKIVLKF